MVNLLPIKLYLRTQPLCSAIIFMIKMAGLLKLLNTNSTGDSIIINSFYNEKGLLIKNTFSDKINGYVVTGFEYDDSGKVLRRKITAPNSLTVSEFKYYPNGRNYEMMTTLFSENKKTVTKSRSTYYPNGLTFEQFLFIGKKAINRDKAYYSYY